ncbi:3-oxoacid CoA-transferase subunit B [Saccharopolyspora elongata]|uniref:3-oxoacid CoA-transferase subunit B n=1 Tax=Saccharopolyspora elongata TaxID=2530387 RepID=A0A4R4YJJ0_9PSEU|nr:3-oxoacid CoA-transferase subunit B [Saccharopolyspora elongata]TDD44264.1 3-oxoacid CoA-transferase subunit B [Saccharopolyspora elongata]
MIEKRSRSEMARAVARDIPSGSYVNLGIGLPVLALEHWTPADDVVVHSENGILGMRALAPGEEPDPNLTNAAKAPVGMVPGGSFFHHADSFAMMRGGHLDYCVLGAYQVSASGDLANWSLGDTGRADAVGGAMDLAVGAKRVHVVMEHLTKDERPRLVAQCSLPLTGAGVVNRVYTDLATVDVTMNGFVVREMVPGLTRAQLQDRTGAPLCFELEEKHV